MSLADSYECEFESLTHSGGQSLLQTAWNIRYRPSAGLFAAPLSVAPELHLRGQGPGAGGVGFDSFCEWQTSSRLMLLMDGHGVSYFSGYYLYFLVLLLLRRCHVYYC